MNKRIISLFITLVMMFSLIPAAFADGYVRIVSRNDSQIEKMLAAIDYQNFDGSGTTAANARKAIEHAVFNARFAAIGGQPFNYPNSGGYVTVIDDGTYKVNIRGAKGCFAYANYVTNLVYGENLGTAGLDREIGRQVQTADTLRNLLLTNAQAGEHIRIGDRHSVAFVSADLNGFYCLSYQNLDPSSNIELQYWTYQEFIDYSYYAGCEIFIFNANTAVNTKTANYNPGANTVGINSSKTVIVPVNTNPFTDITPGSPYYDAVLWIYNKGITKGYTATEYNTNAPCDRAQVVTFLWRAAGCPNPKETVNVNPFSDVNPNSYYYQALIWAALEGICKGYGDGTFHPNETVTRGQFVTMLWRYKGSPQVLFANNPFSDVSSGSFYNAIIWGNRKDIIKGYSDGTFRPNEPCTRGHVALFMYRCFN